MKFNTTIPEGGIYVTANNIELTEGNNFPVLKNEDTFYYGDYFYIYNKNRNGWRASVGNKNKTEYGEILSSINNTPVNSLCRTFYQCKSLVKAPKIPNTITNMHGAFSGCTSLKSVPAIPNGVTNIQVAFSGCASLIDAPEIPDEIINMEGVFADCICLREAPKIPNNIMYMNFTFNNCKSLAGNIVVPKSADLLYTFTGCDSLKTVTFKNPNQDIGFVFSLNTKIKVKGLSKEAQNIAKEMYPNIRFEEPSKLSKFLENEKGDDAYEI